MRFAIVLFALLTASLAHAAPTCTLSGVTDPKIGAPKQQGFAGSVQGLIHLDFKAHTLSDCKSEIDEYCRAMVARGFRPKSLSGHFSDSSGIERPGEFTVTRDCQIRND